MSPTNIYTPQLTPRVLSRPPPNRQVRKMILRQHKWESYKRGVVRDVLAQQQEARSGRMSPR